MSDASTPLAFDYRPRTIRSGGVHAADGWRLKLYTILHERRDPDPELNDAAVAAALDALPRPGAGPEHYGVGFVVVHRGESYDFVTVGFWAYQTELRLLSFMRASSGTTLLEPVQGDELSTDVWDLAVLGHEREAWTRHVLHGEPADVEAYARDRMEGEL